MLVEGGAGIDHRALPGACPAVSLVFSASWFGAAGRLFLLGVEGRVLLCDCYIMSFAACLGHAMQYFSGLPPYGKRVRGYCLGAAWKRCVCAV